MPRPDVSGVVLMGGTSTSGPSRCRHTVPQYARTACALVRGVGGGVGSGGCVWWGWVVGTLLGPEGAGMSLRLLRGPPGAPGVSLGV
jgi:hypothetical protein